MVLSVVDYNPSSGDFHWRWRQGRERTTLTWNSRFAFKKCSSINSDGYLMIMINGKAYPAHRLAWLIVYGTMPDGFIDHINRVRTDIPAWANDGVALKLAVQVCMDNVIQPSDALLTAADSAYQTICIALTKIPPLERRNDMPRGSGNKSAFTWNRFYIEKDEPST